MAIRTALQAWGKPANIVGEFDGARLHNYYEQWAQFVQTDWSHWDISEYDHDIGCRYWIQIAIEHATPQTRVVLEQTILPIDETFIAQMRPCEFRQYSAREPLSNHPYFWEINTIYPQQGMV
jgi:hypothetical protein